MTDFFWNRPRVNRISWAFIFAIILAVIVGIFFYPSDRKAITKGDFPAFYTAAVFVEEGLGAELYNPRLQQKIQNRYWPEMNWGHFHFAYPPYVAFMVSPLAKLPPTASKVFFVSFMLACLFLSIRILYDEVPIFKRNPVATTACLFTFAPLLLALVGGQNTSLSMLCLAGILKSQSIKKWGDVLAGICLGLWFFKPQFALIFWFFFLIKGRYKVLLWTLPIGAIYYGMGAIVSGAHWPSDWFEAAAWFSEEDFFYNKNRMICILGFFKALQPFVDLGQKEFWVINLLGYGLSLALLLWIVLKRLDLSSLLIVAAPAAVLISSHTLYYDISLCLIPVAMHMQLKTDREINFLIGLLCLIGASTLLRSVVPVQPLFFVALWAFYFVYKNQVLEPSSQSRIHF